MIRHDLRQFARSSHSFRLFINDFCLRHFSINIDYMMCGQQVKNESLPWEYNYVVLLALHVSQMHSMPYFWNLRRRIRSGRINVRPSPFFSTPFGKFDVMS